MKTIVDVNSVEKSYGLTQVIKHCSFKIYEGEIYGLLGINGAGKTTLMKMILGLQQIDSGSIYVDGKKLHEEISFPENTGIVIENMELLPRFSARQNLKILAKIRNKADDRSIT